MLRLALLLLGILLINSADAGMRLHGSDATPAITYNIATYTNCNGTGNDEAGFATWLSDAITWQATHTGLIQLDVASGKVCMFTGVGTSPSIFAGLKSFRLNAYGATFSDNSGAGNGYFLGGGVTAGIQQNGTASTGRIATVAAGSSSITLLDTAKCSLWSAGDRAVLGGLNPQSDGYPPNPMFFDYVQIASVASCAGSGVITLAAPLANSYKSTWPLYNVGSGGQPDQGGPATLYAYADQTWDTQQEYRGVTFAFSGQLAVTGRDITFRDATATSPIIPSQNLIYRWIGGSLSGLQLEIDKIIGTAIFQGTTIKTIDFQSASVQDFQLINSVVENLNGTGIVSTISGSTIDSFVPGAHSFGASGAVTVSNSTLSAIGVGGASQNNINLRGTWALGKLTVPHNFQVTSAANNGSGLIRLLVDSTAGYSTGFVTEVIALSGSASCQGTWTITVVDGTHFDLQGSTFVGTCGGNGGSLPLNWAVPGANIQWQGRWTQGPGAQITDITQDATNTYVQTTLSGGFPTMPLASGVATVHAHPAPKFTCTNCIGSVDAVDLSNPSAAGVPLWSYSKRTLNAGNCSPTPPVVPIYGKLTTLNVIVSAAYVGASLNIQLGAGGGFIQDLTSASTSTVWDPTVNAKVASATPRVVTTTGASGAQSGDSLAIPSPGVNTWLVQDQLSPECSANISSSGDPVTATVEIITNQGVVYP